MVTAIASKWNREEISKGVKEVFVDCLGVDDEEVVPTASISKDLGAESIDFLDISFRLEKKFEIKVGDRKMFDAQERLSIIQQLIEFRKPGYKKAEAEIASVQAEVDRISVQNVIDYVIKKLREDGRFKGA